MLWIQKFLELQIDKKFCLKIKSLTLTSLKKFDSDYNILKFYSYFQKDSQILEIEPKKAKTFLNKLTVTIQKNVRLTLFY